MESPPKPRRAVIPSLSLLAAPETSTTTSIAESSNSHANNTPPFAKSNCTATVATTSATAMETSDGEMPNLLTFVNDVAIQREKQVEYLEERTKVLEERKLEYKTLTTKLARLQEEQKSIQRKTYLAMEESAMHGAKVSELRDNILKSLEKESRIEDELLSATAEKSLINEQAIRRRMKAHAEKIRLGQENSETGKKIAEVKRNIARNQEEAKKIRESLEEVDEDELQQEIEDLKKEKQKLTEILQRKKDFLKSEDEWMRKMELECEIEKKRVAAQKLRLRSRIREKKQLLQQMEEEAAVLQIQIDDLKNHK